MKKSSWGMITLLGIAVLFLAAGCGGGGGGTEDTSPHTVGGKVSGLTTGHSIVLQLNGANDLTVDGDADGVVSFDFPVEVAYGDPYAVTVLTPPAGFGHFWSVANDSGTIRGHDVNDVRVNGNLDDAFGDDGIFVSDGTAGVGDFTGNDIGHGMVLDSAGNILVVGESERSSGDSDMVIWRYDPVANDLDDTFGSGGIVKYNSGNGSDAGYAIALARDGSGDILVTGETSNASHVQVMTVWRYDSSGALVDSFGTHGVRTYADPLYSSRGNSILVDKNGRILVTGTRTNDVASGMVIWRLLAGGGLDPLFDTDGVAAYDSATGFYIGSYEGISVALVDPNNTTSAILVTGSFTDDTGTHMAVWKYDTTGEPVGTFGGYDSLLADDILIFGNYYSSGYSITLAGSDILVAGYLQNNSAYTDMAIWRFDSTGDHLVPGFGSGGIVTADNAAGGNGDDLGFFITRDDGGNILVAGESQNESGDYDLALWKFTASGAPYSSSGVYFGANGVLVGDSPVGGDGQTAGTSLAIDEDGKIIVAGASTNASDEFDMVVWQYYPDTTTEF